ncbi:hypothetical protein [Streptomyces sp. NPDC057363]|uniref:hypothetical protein n=1 Tax=Streptomyces sp. NPDC057363 TaxID=3346107 RepID=UPI0036388473
MGENDKEATDLFGGLVEGLEEELNAKLLEKKSVFALTCARITGAVYTEAVSSGVPADLAKDMATDSWMAFMGFTISQAVAPVEGEN